MTTLIYILIVFFVCLIGYQLFLALSPKSLIEGVENMEDTSGTVTTSPESGAAPPPTSVEGTITTGDETTNVDVTYTPYPMGGVADQALALSNQNKNNITSMKPKIDKIDKLESDIAAINGNIDTLQSQMDDLAAQAGNLGTELSGDVTADTTVTGLGSTDTSTEAQNEMNAIDDEDEADNPQQQADSALL